MVTSVFVSCLFFERQTVSSSDRSLNCHPSVCVYQRKTGDLINMVCNNLPIRYRTVLHSWLLPDTLLDYLPKIPELKSSPVYTQRGHRSPYLSSRLRQFVNNCNNPFSQLCIPSSLGFSIYCTPDYHYSYYWQVGYVPIAGRSGYHQTSSLCR